MEISGEELNRIVAFVNRRPWLMEGNPTHHHNHENPPVSVNENSHGNSYLCDKLGLSEAGDSSLHRISAWHASPDQFEAFLNHMDAHQQQFKAGISRKATEEHATTMMDDGSHFKVNNENLPDNTIDRNSSKKPSSTTTTYRDMTAPPSLAQRNHKGVSALHIVVYRNSFHVTALVDILLRRQPSLASQTMSCGSTPLHILCAHNVTIRKGVLLSLLRADPSAVWKEDCNGDTPLSLLWKNVLRFRWAQSDEIQWEDDDNNNEEDEEEEQEDSMYSSINGIRRDRFRRRQRQRRPHQSWMTVISPSQFVEYSLLMIQAAMGKTTRQEPLTLVNICQMPRCPPLLVHLVLEYSYKLACLFPNLAPLVSDAAGRLTDRYGMTALHHAIQAKTVTRQFVPSHVLAKTRSVVDCLLERFPDLVFLRDHQGRLPLHYALEKDLRQLDLEDLQSYYRSLYCFVKTHPDSLGKLDPVTQLYPFALLASSSTNVVHHHCDHSMNSNNNKNEDDMDVVDDDEESHHHHHHHSMTSSLDAVRDLMQLEAIFRMLRSAPETGF